MSGKDAAMIAEARRQVDSLQVGPSSWREAVRILKAVLVSGTNKGVEEASRELQRCAAIADACGPLLAIVDRIEGDDGASGVFTREDLAAIHQARSILKIDPQGDGTRPAPITHF